VRADVETQRQYVQDLRANCIEAIRLSASAPNTTNDLSALAIFPQVAAVDPGNSWATFRTYLTAVTTYCARETNKQWVGRLAGADVYDYDNAYAMIASLRIDSDILGPFGVM